MLRPAGVLPPETPCMPNTLLRTSALVWTKQRMARGMFVLMHSTEPWPKLLVAERFDVTHHLRRPDYVQKHGALCLSDTPAGSCRARRGACRKTQQPACHEATQPAATPTKSSITAMHPQLLGRAQLSEEERFYALRPTHEGGNRQPPWLNDPYADHLHRQRAIKSASGA